MYGNFSRIMRVAGSFIYHQNMVLFVFTARMKHRTVRPEYIFIAISLVTFAYFKNAAEKEFSRLHDLLTQTQVRLIAGTRVPQELSWEFDAYTAFDSNLKNKLTVLYATVPPDKNARNYPAQIDALNAKFLDFSNCLAETENRLRFGYESLIYSSLALLFITILILMLKAAERQKQSVETESRQAEQRAISRELHDGAAQKLAVLRLQLQDENTLPQTLLPAVDGAISEIRWLCGVLRFDMSDSFDKTVTELCSSFEKAYAIPTSFFCASEHITHLVQKQKLELIRIIEESFSNIMRHAHAQHVTVKAIDVGDMLVLSIHDNGIGFDESIINSGDKQGHHVGIKSIQERAQLLNGTAAWKNENGTTLTLIIPAVLQTRHL